MKNSIILLFLCSFLSCEAHNNTPAPPYQASLVSYQPTSLLENIEQKIKTAFIQSMIQQDNSDMDKLAKQLKEVSNPKAEKLAHYWRAYLHYYQTIYFMENNEEKAAEKHIDKAIDLLENMEEKNSEDYALLAMARGLSIPFKAGIRAPFISGKASKNANKALELNQQNPRAYFVIASNDFYTPEQYGGGKIVEENLLKAINLPAQDKPNPYLPAWGHQEAYEMLIKFYIKKERWDDAKSIFAVASEKFPNNHQISKLASKLINK